MGVVLGVEDDLARELLGLLVVHVSEVYLSVEAGEAVANIGDGLEREHCVRTTQADINEPAVSFTHFEEGCATSSGPTDDERHLAGLEDTIEVVD